MNVSVIIPSYNRAPLLGATLDSIVGQTLPPGQVIVADDGSTDDTAAVLTGWQRQHPEWRARLLVLHQENQGKSVALNAALRHVQGDWIAYDDSDDLWRADKLERQHAALAAYPTCGACFTNAQYVNNPEMTGTSFAQARRRYGDGVGLIEDAARLVLEAPHGIFMQTIVVRADVMRAAGDFDPAFRVSQDTDFLFRLGLKTPFCYVGAPLVEIDRRSERTTGLTTQFTRRGRLRLGVLERMYEKWLRLVEAERPDLRDGVRMRLASIRNELANFHLREGDPAAARQCLASALRTRFSPALAAKLVATTLAPSWVARRAARD